MIYQLEILNPEVQALLDSLAKMNLIKIQRLEAPENTEDILRRLRAQSAEEELSEADILREVETVRAERYARSNKGNH